MEILDIVNEKDEVVGSAPQNEIYERKLPHRIVHVLIFDEIGRMALQKRSQQKKFCPGYWCTTAGGHVQTGEKYEQAAQRETLEEIGWWPPALEPVGMDYYEDAGGLKKFLATFKTIYGGKFNANPAAVAEVKYFTLEELRTMAANNEKIHPELLFLLKKYYL